MLWDTHMHTSFSGDSTADPDSMAEAAIEHGLSGICITDHEDLEYPEPDICFELNFPEYEAAIRGLAERFRGRLPILWGVEIGLQTQLAGVHRELIRSYNFDIVIGSSHVVHGVDPYYGSYYEGRTELEAYREYFESILENIQAFDDFDVYGHLDYVVRYGPNKDAFYSYQAFSDIFDEILRILIRKGKGIELNTAGFKYGLEHPNPTEDVIRRYRELGGEIITIGSDAHKPEHVAYAFGRVPAILRSCGFSHYTVFRNRKPEFLPLP